MYVPSLVSFKAEFCKASKRDTGKNNLLKLQTVLGDLIQSMDNDGICK